MDYEKIIEAGKITSEVKKWIKPKIKKDVPLLEIAELIEKKIYELGGSPAFPVNLSINEYAAHYTPSHDDETLAHGLLKVDFGVEMEGWIADNSFSVDLENSQLNKELIKASREALEESETRLSPDVSFGEIGKLIETTIKRYGFNPIANLSGHSMEQYDLHSGLNVPNVENGSEKTFNEGLYAIEPFATNGKGFIHEGKKGNIYLFQKDKNTRNPLGREILEFIKDTYGSLPFASRWVVKEFGTKAILALNHLENEGILHHYSILTEEKGKIVSQAENTFLVTREGIINTTK
ncbi:type II methionyl aminopeptidase [Candidatus Pacearchaeota archaeon CG10_big_fil_rev_8_21_14_0_10_32_42]|nr:MAG: type II methionyl aminopeptidase [Candidatus Pacearchaeota archaeon CG10_big_fil_rev_8_21_14_0_10_32_42]